MNGANVEEVFIPASHCEELKGWCSLSEEWGLNARRGATSLYLNCIEDQEEEA